MLDGYAASNVKKIQRGGTRGGVQAGTPQAAYNKGPTGPLLAQKVVQLPKQARAGPQAANLIESEE